MSLAPLIPKKSKFDFSDYHKVSNIKIDDKWLEWFVGFFEGDGTLVNGEKSFHFSITQDEQYILYHIRERLGFGKVRKYTNQEKWVFVVEDRDNIMKILYILNGNLVLNHRYKNLKKIISEFNIRLFKGKLFHTIIKFKEQQVLPTLNDGWFSGFADAEGCFYCPIETKRRHVSHYISIVFEIGQNGETWFFSYIQSLFEGGIIHPKNSSEGTHNRIYFKGYSKVTKIITYFDKFGVRTEH